MENKEVVMHHLMARYFQEVEKHCNETVLSRSPPDDDLYCPAVVDMFGGLCFNYTKAGTIAYAECPVFGIDNNPSGYSFRLCQANGTWQTLSTGKEYTNFSMCLHNDTNSLDHLHSETSHIYLFTAMAALSVILLTISLSIFFGFRQLRCDRITIHKNLFFSYLLTSLFWLLYYQLVVLREWILLHNPLWCQLLNLLAQTCTTSNFSWMLCEGLYLHIIMAHALRTGKKLIKCLVIAGWSVPVLLTVIYGLVRFVTAHHTDQCWMVETDLQWIVAAPITASVVINICILVNLVRLLMTKLRQCPEALQSRKAVKATLILVPLLGLQMLLFPVRPDQSSKFYMVYVYLWAILQSSQGTLVSVIFCFCNGEVRSLLRRKWHQHRLTTGSSRKNTAACTSTTLVDGCSVVDNARPGTGHRYQSVSDNGYKNTETMEMKNTPLATTPLIKKDNQVELTHLLDDSIQGTGDAV